MIHSPAISIIVPVYKTEKYIARCLDSLVNQTFRNIEIICVNDGSPDNAFTICADYAGKDTRIVLLSQVNQGPSAARNTGLLHAKGAYIQFCDSDDYFDITMCEKMYNAVSTTGADIVVSNTNVIYENIPVCSDESWFRVPFTGLSMITDKTFKQINVYVWNKIFKKELVEKYNIVFPYGLYYEDAGFFFKYLMVAKTTCCIGDSLYNYVRRKDSIMGETVKEKPPYTIDHIYVIKDVADFMRANELSGEFKQVFVWMVLLYTKLSYLHGGKTIYGKAFEAGAELLSCVDFNTVLAGSRNPNNILRLYALKTNDPDLFFLLLPYDKSTKDRLFAPVSRIYLLFPWYVYKIYCVLLNKDIPEKNIKFLVKAYLLFPYYVLKVYLTLLMHNGFIDHREV